MHYKISLLWGSYVREILWRLTKNTSPLPAHGISGGSPEADGDDGVIWPTRHDAKFVYFYQKEKICKIFCKNPLTTLALCDKIVKCIIIALTMGTAALAEGCLSMKGDFPRPSLFISTKGREARSIRLRPRHLPCPWVVRLTHEVPDVRTPTFGRLSIDCLSPAAARESARRCPPTILNGVFYSWSI